MSDLPGEHVVDPRNLRVSDAEREHVVGLLQKAIGQGLLDLDEFTDRTDRALAARTRAELNAVLVDLPGMVHRDAVRPAPRESLELRATMSTLKRAGRWVVPRELVVRNKMGSTQLDFTDALIEHPVVEIELDVTAGSTTLLVPDGATVDTDGLEIAAGSLRDRIGSDGRIGRPHFVLKGQVRAGSVTVRRPSYVRLGSLVVRFPWRVFTNRD